MTYPACISELKEPWVFIAHQPIYKPDIPEGILLLELDAYLMTTLGGLYQEFTSKFQFPDYFGENLNALDECLTDLEWLPSAGYLLSIKNAEYLLKEEADDIFEGLLSILKNAGEEWATPITQGEEWDREGLPFHTILELGEVNLSGFQKKLRQVSFDISELS